MSRQAKDNPVSSSVLEDTEDMEIHQQQPRTMKATGAAKDSLDSIVLARAQEMPDEEWVNEMRFNEEKVVIVVAESTDKYASPIVEVWNDGRCQRFLRGEAQECKRKFVEVLARCRRTTYTQKTVKDEDGNDAIVNVPHTAPMYPFQVVQDTPKGRAWLKRIMAEA